MYNQSCLRSNCWHESNAHYRKAMWHTELVILVLGGSDMDTTGLKLVWESAKTTACKDTMIVF